MSRAAATARAAPTAEARHGPDGEPAAGDRGARGSAGRTRSSTEEQIRAFVHDQLAAVDARRAQRVRARARRHPQLPAAAAAVGGPRARCTAASRRLTVLVALGTHAAMSEQALAAHLGYRPARSADRYPGDDRAQPRVVGPVHVRATSGTISAERIAELSDGMLRPHRARAGQPRRGRARRHADRRPGIPARGRRVLRRQQVPFPRRLRAAS